MLAITKYMLFALREIEESGKSMKMSGLKDEIGVQRGGESEHRAHSQ